MVLAGIEIVSYTSKKDGQLKEGVNIYWTEEITDKGEGVRCKSEYVRRSVVDGNPALVVGQNYRIFYNKYRQVDGWIVLDN